VPLPRLRRRLLGVYLEFRVVPLLAWPYTAVTLGTAIAADDRGLVVGWAYLLAMAVALLLQGLVAHGVNEIVDWRSGTDKDPAARVLSGGSKVIASGLLSVRELAWLAAGAALAGAALGLVAAATRGWVLVLFGLGGLAAAVFYTLPPVRGAYRPFAGEALTFVSMWGCVAGAYVVQAGRLAGPAALAGVGYASSCVAMLMMHHYLDSGPDARAFPPKRTSVVRFGQKVHRYAIAWASVAVACFAVLAVWDNPGYIVGALGLGLVLLVHVAVDPDDPPETVTRAELWIILLGMAAGLGTAAALAPELSWALLPPVLLVPLELRISERAHQRLFAERAASPPHEAARSSRSPA